jgi:archaellum component FlaF (FlaF/FlaG flagellin family)
MAKRLLVVGIVIFVIEVSVGAMVPALTVYSSNGSPVTANLQSTTVNPEELLMDHYTFPAGGPLTVTLRNAGSLTENLQNADYYVDGILGTASSNSCTGGDVASALAPRQSCVITISLQLTNVSPDGAYQFKVVTPSGQVFLFLVFYGYSG